MSVYGNEFEYLIEASNKENAKNAVNNAVNQLAHILKLINSNDKVTTQEYNASDWGKTVGEQGKLLNSKLSNKAALNMFIDNNNIDELYQKAVSLANSEMSKGYGGKYKPMNLNIPKDTPKDFISLKDLTDIESVIKYTEKHITNEEAKKKAIESIRNYYNK